MGELLKDAQFAIFPLNELRVCHLRNNSGLGYLHDNRRCSVVTEGKNPARKEVKACTCLLNVLSGPLPFPSM
jgi:hypothetical protein